MITLIDRTNILREYPKLLKGVLRASEKTTIDSFWDSETLFQHLINFEAFAFIEEKSGYCGVFQFSYSPKAKILNFFWSGKDPDNPNPVDWGYIDEFLEYTAKGNQCTIIQCEGRRGWKKILEPLGYIEDSVLFIREVPNELHVLPPVQE